MLSKGRECSLFLLLCIFCGSIISQSTLPTCDESFLTGSYSRCSSVNNTRTLIYYYSVGCNTTNAPSLPQPVENLPCGKKQKSNTNKGKTKIWKLKRFFYIDIDCSPGYYLPLDSVECEICPPGSYSLGGGERFYEWQDNFPKSPYAVFNTYCSESNSTDPSNNYPLCG